jgi:DNA-binding transcriptional regulator YdaS (Cro superfamily)
MSRYTRRYVMILKEYLFRVGITQIVFAKKVGVCSQSISDYVTGRRRPHPNVALKISEATKGSVSIEEALFPERHATIAPVKHKRVKK